MRHDPRLRPGPLLHQLCKRKDGKDIRIALAEMAAALDANQQYNNELQFQRRFHGVKYDVRIMLDIQGTHPNNQTMLVLLTLNNFNENDRHMQINEGYDVSINRNAMRHGQRTDRVTISNGSTIEIKLPIHIPSTIADQMIGKPFGDVAEQAGILRAYKDMSVKHVFHNHPDDPARVEILLDGIVWDAGIASAFYSALRDAGEDAI